MNYDDTVDFKVNCNSAEYFKLFEPYIPKLKLGSTVLLYAISNVDCLKNIIDKNQDCVYYIYDTNVIFDVLKTIHENNNIILVNDISEVNMKFDCIIMNPPYQRDLHLKILKEAYKHIDVQNGKVVCLHPGKWLRRFDYWKNKWNTFKIESVKLIDDILSRTIFSDATIGSQLIVSVLSEKGSTDIKKYSKYIPWVKEKIIDKAPYILGKSDCKFRTFTDGHKFQLNLPIVHGNPGCYDMTEITSKKYEKALAVKYGKRPQDVNTLAFDTENERKNFYDSTFTIFYKFLISLCRDGQTATSCYYALPVMDDYTEPWTDERFYQFFNITKEEQAFIEETMKKYS